MRKLLSLVMGCVLLQVYNCRAQLPGIPKNIQSPNTATLGLFGEVPVSYFTGVPNIEIPLYTLKENGIEVPLTLRYHASGVRPDMHPGWVGMGWSLEAGGVISRTVRDQPDDYRNPWYGDDFLGFYFSHDLLNSPNWDQIPYMTDVVTDIYKSNYKDIEPDEFSFSFPGCSGKFYLDETGKWKAKCDKPVKVTFDGQFLSVPGPIPWGTDMVSRGNFPSFSGFTITDENGNQYVFGGDTKAIEYDMDFFLQNKEEWIAQAWHLTKIIHADGYTVNFLYEKDDYINQLGIYMGMDIKTNVKNTGGFWEPRPECSSSFYTNNFYYFTGGKLISPSYLRSINCSSGSILFTRSTSTELRYLQQVYDTRYSNWSDLPNNADGKGLAFLPFLGVDGSGNEYPACLNKLQWKKLDVIKISGNDGNVKKSFQFTYNNIATERLTLKSLTESGASGGTKPPYQFNYITAGPKPLPHYLACQTDHWGFFNGTVPDINDQNNYYRTYYDYRETHPEYLQTGTLNKITYPTGAVTEFTYEPHIYGKRLAINRTDGIDPTFNTNTAAGGLRVKKISSYDPGSSMPAKTKEYFYVSGYNNTLNTTQINNLQSSGVLGGQIKYFFDDYETKATNDSRIIYSKDLFSSQSVLPASSNSAGTHIGYSEVVEKLADGSYTKYYYTNFDNGHIDEPVPSLQITRTPYEQTTSLALERGFITKQEAFNNNNVPVLKKEIYYTPLNKGTEFIRVLNVHGIGVCGPGTVVAEGVAYRNYTYSYLPHFESVTKYDVNGNNPINTIRQFAYDSHRQQRWESFTDSKGQSATTWYRYPYDVIGYTPSVNATTNEITAYMVQHNQIGSPMEIVNTKVINGVDQVTDSKLITYNTFPGMIKPFRNYKFITTAPVPKTSYTNYMVTGYNGNEIVNIDSRLKMDMTVSSYDARGNVQTFAKDKDVKSTRLWDYKKNYPVADITNADISQVAYTSFETEDLGGWTTVSGSILVNNGNVTGQKSFSGVCTTSVARGVNYVLTLWGKAGAMQSVNGQGGTVKRVIGNNVLYEWLLYDPGKVTVTSDNCDELRLVPEGASIATYTYDPYAGMTTKTDWNNLSTFYEYDEFARLHFIRDHERNLVKKINYNYRGATSPVYYNEPYSQSFNKLCSGQYSSGTYTVPAGRYSALDPQEANNLARQDAAQNGEIWVQQNTPCNNTSISVDYFKEGNIPYTVTYENLVTHAVYYFTFNAAATYPNFIHLGWIPSGRYDVTITTPSTAGHTFILGGLGQNGTTTATFSNVKLTVSWEAQIIINGNL